MFHEKSHTIDIKKIPHKSNHLLIRKEKDGLLVYNRNSKRKFFINKNVEKFLELCDGRRNFFEIISKFPKIKKEESIKLLLDLTRADLINVGRENTNERSLAIYPYTISNITTPILSAPLHIYWEITYRCNLNCKHCYVKDRKLKAKELGLNDCYKIIDQLSKLKVFEITFSGGEPLLKEGIINLIKYTTEKGIAALITTNGTLIDKNFARKLKKAGLQAAQVSLDSPEEEVHDDFRGVHGAFKAVLAGIKNLLQVDIPVVLATVPTNKNIKKIKNLMKLAKSMGVQGYRILECKNFGRGEYVMDDIISFDEYKNLLKTILKERQKKGAPILLSESFAFLLNKNFQKIPNKPLIDCPAGRSMLSISPEGLVSPCSYFAFAGLTIGNIKDRKISEIWRQSPLLKELRTINFSLKKDSNKTCNSCKYVRQCGRGCRALAYKATGNIRGLDPRCFLKNKGLK